MDLFSRQEELGIRILQNCRNELCDIFPYLDGAFSCLPCRSRREAGFATDGAALYFFPSELLHCYEADSARLLRGYLHMLLHCLYLHLFRPADVEPTLWNLACDIAVEQLIAAQEVPRLGSLSLLAAECLSTLGPVPLAAEKIALLLQDGKLPYSWEELQTAFSFDDHRIWEKTLPAGVRSRWAQALAHASQSRQGKGKRRGTVSGMREEELSPAESVRLDYRKYLQRFTVSREELELDEDSFDYIYYHLGMENYGSMPLIEPLEYKEVYRLEELVIAIDTSGSCSREVVSRFLAETYEILTQRENFFRKMNVYFLQCDCVIQDVARIRSREEWKEYLRRMKIQGRGGTDFRPVFQYIQKLREEKKLKKLKALICFTDGDGIYPTAPPDYETVFVLLKDSGRPDLLPKWAKKLLIG